VPIAGRGVRDVLESQMEKVRWKKVRWGQAYILNIAKRDEKSQKSDGVRPIF